MNKRMLKKLEKSSGARSLKMYHLRRKLCHVLSRRKNDPFYLTLRVVRRAKLETSPDLLDPVILVREWEKIDRYVERSIRHEYKDLDWRATVDHGIAIADRVLANGGRRGLEYEGLDLISAVSQTLYYDLTYFSDRWCLWRYAYVHNLMGKLKELLCQASSMS